MRTKISFQLIRIVCAIDFNGDFEIGTRHFSLESQAPTSFPIIIRLFFAAVRWLFFVVCPLHLHFVLTNIIQIKRKSYKFIDEFHQLKHICEFLNPNLSKVSKIVNCFSMISINFNAKPKSIPFLSNQTEFFTLFFYAPFGMHQNRLAIDHFSKFWLFFWCRVVEMATKKIFSVMKFGNIFLRGYVDKKMRIVLEHSTVCS